MQRTESRVVTVGRLFGALALLLVPWTAYLFLTLPPRARAENYDLAWGGFDVGLVALLGLSAIAAVRQSPWLSAVAGGTATSLVTDAWFDVVTAPTTADRWIASAMAVLVELPLALVCAWAGPQRPSPATCRRGRPTRPRGGPISGYPRVVATMRA